MALIGGLVQSTDEITKMITKDIIKHLNTLFVAKKAPVELIARELLSKNIIAQPEVQSLLKGGLRYEFGIVDPAARILYIIDRLALNVETDFVPVKLSNGTLKGGITIHSVGIDYSSVLSMNDAVVVTEKGETLPWLEWLLLEGNNTVIADYDIEYGIFGRTGGAHMVPGNGWQVPSQFAGTANDNFITRAVSQMQAELREEVSKCLV